MMPTVMSRAVARVDDWDVDELAGELGRTLARVAEDDGVGVARDDADGVGQ
jgi:hypothetical protein